ncbi:MAG: hypothetical protein AABX51_00075 [Nanoarchaeota archaeon]
MTAHIQYLHGQTISLLEKGDYRQAVVQSNRMMQGLERILQRDDTVDYDIPLYTSVAANYLAGNKAEAKRGISVLEAMAELVGKPAEELGYWKKITSHNLGTSLPSRPSEAYSKAAHIVYNLAEQKERKYYLAEKKKKDEARRKTERAEVKRSEAQFRTHREFNLKPITRFARNNFHYAKDIAKGAIVAGTIGVAAYFAAGHYETAAVLPNYAKSAYSQTADGLNMTVNGAKNAAEWSADGIENIGAGIENGLISAGEWTIDGIVNIGKGSGNIIKDGINASADWSSERMHDSLKWTGNAIKDFQKAGDPANDFNSNTTLFVLNEYNLGNLNDNGGLETIASAIEASPKSLSCNPAGNEQISDFLGDGSRAAIHSGLRGLIDGYYKNGEFEEATLDAPANHLLVKFERDQGKWDYAHCTLDVTQIPVEITNLTSEAVKK